MARISLRAFLQLLEAVGVFFLINICCHPTPVFKNYNQIINKITGFLPPYIITILIIFAILSIITLYIMARREGLEKLEKYGMINDVFYPIIIAGLIYLIISRIGNAYAPRGIRVGWFEGRMAMLSMVSMIFFSAIILFPMSIAIDKVLRKIFPSSTLEDEEKEVLLG